MYRTHTCGELNHSHINQNVVLSGWIQRIRDKGVIKWIDLRDKFGITQLIFDQNEQDHSLGTLIKTLGREYVIQVWGKVQERYAKNPNLKTGDIELVIEKISVLSEAIAPPFLIEDKTDGGEELRMQYRYLDLRRSPIRQKLELRYTLSKSIRQFLDQADFVEVETPVLIKSTPEGARDFLVPSRMNKGEFYALPQSPQTFKQLLMVGGLDRYFQIVKCFRDEDLRADRQPEFTQIDCEMSFVDQEDVLTTFEDLTKHLFKTHKNIDLETFPRLSYHEAISTYGNDKPDLRFDMKIHTLNTLVKGKGFGVFDAAEVVLAIGVEGGANYSRKQLDELRKWVKQPQLAASGLVYLKCQQGKYKSSVDKFYDQHDLETWAKHLNVREGDLILILAGEKQKTYKIMSELRLEMGNRLGLRDDTLFAPLWVVDFPMFEKNEDENRWQAMHHPFTAPLSEDENLLDSNPEQVRAKAYDLVINGVELGGGSIRIFDSKLQAKVFDLLSFSKEESEAQFGFLMKAFQYGAPPHGGIAFGFDRLCALFAGVHSIRDFIAFPKNTSGRDTMIDSPNRISEQQMKDLGLKNAAN